MELSSFIDKSYLILINPHCFLVFVILLSNQSSKYRFNLLRLDKFRGSKPLTQKRSSLHNHA